MLCLNKQKMGEEKACNVYFDKHCSQCRDYVYGVRFIIPSPLNAFFSSLRGKENDKSWTP